MLSKMTDSKNFKVVLTGFGPFEGHEINASWETAKELSKSNLQDLGIDLQIEQIPVDYLYVMEKIPKLWQQHQPDLMVHLGVSSIATELTLESLAHKSGYVKSDIKDNVPPSQCCCYGNEESICPQFNLEKICQQINEMNQLKVKSCISANAGRYLCEFTFYTSLCINRSKVVFIHVPEINKPYTVNQMAECIKTIITLLCQQLKTCESKNVEM